MVRWLIKVPGRACHSSYPQEGVNAIYRMGHLLNVIEQYADHLTRLEADPRLGTPTISVGKIQGGVSVNTVPDFCTIEIDRRLLPGEKPEDAPLELEKFLIQHPVIDFPFIIEPSWLACPALKATNNHEVLRRLGSAINSVTGKHEILAVPFGTDGSSIAEAGIPCVVFGPGDIAQAHTKDEWIELKQVEQAAEILYRLCTAD